MPIIEYFHNEKIYRVSVALTVEWGTQTYTRHNSAYAPFVGYGEDYKCHTSNVFEYPVEKQNEAFEKMAQLWNNWKNAGFPAVDHA